MSSRRNRSRNSNDDASPEPGAAGGKGHATPKRRVARKDDVPTPVSSGSRAGGRAARRAAGRARRDKQRQARAREKQAMITGDERYMPQRDRGHVRRYVRNYVDARLNVGEFFIPASLALVVVVIAAGNRPAFAVTAIVALYVVVVATIVDAVVLGRQVVGAVSARFGAAPQGTAAYAAMRAVAIRRTRLPRPLVTRGEYPA